jgi:hypothetical protein
MRDPILRSMVVHSREMLAELFRCAVVQQGRQSGQPTRERSSVMMSLDCLAAPSADASNVVRPAPSERPIIGNLLRFIRLS